MICYANNCVKKLALWSELNQNCFNFHQGNLLIDRSFCLNDYTSAAWKYQKAERCLDFHNQVRRKPIVTDKPALKQLMDEPSLVNKSALHAWI